MPVLFADRALVSRVERAECSMVTDCAVAAKRRRPETELFVQKLGGGVAICVAESSPFNKVAGLGFGEAIDDAELDAMERAFRRRNVPIQVELASLAKGGLGERLTKRGYRLVGFENVLGKPIHRDHTFESNRATEATVEEVGEAGIERWLDVMVTGFCHPDSDDAGILEQYPREALERDIGDMAELEGFVRYSAKRDGEWAGSASMRIHGEIAQLCGAATLPEHRRRGVQGALLMRRLERARDAGCSVAIVTTQPGSQSQQNAQRKGFELLYARAVLVLEG
jgi:GNAT superfamily N-acetyltransferase